MKGCDFLVIRRNTIELFQFGFFFQSIGRTIVVDTFLISDCTRFPNSGVFFAEKRKQQLNFYE